MNRYLENKLIVFIVAAACLILYFNSLWNVFIFDDLHTIPENLYIKDIRYAPLFFQGQYTSLLDIPKGMFRPLLMLTFMFNYYFSGLAPFSYHLLNILIHFVNAILVYSLLKFLKKDIGFAVALCISLLFTSHPINTETVSYLSCRSDLLVSLLVLGAFLCYVKKKFLSALLLYTLSLLTKETALVFGLLVFAYDFIYSCPVQQPKHYKRNRYIFYGILLAVSVSYWLYRSAIFSTPVKDTFLTPLKSPVRSFSANFFTQLFVTLYYLKLFIWPHPLNLHHYVPDFHSFFHPLVFFSAVIIVAMISLVLILKKKKPLVSFGLAWYFICLLPKFYAMLNFPAMEHHFYLPGIGVYFIIAALSGTLYLKYRRKFIIVTIGALSIFSVLVWFRNYELKDNLILYKMAVKRNPYSAVAQNNLAIEYSRMGLSEPAEASYKKALSLSRSIDVQVNCRINLARIYLSQQKYKDAIAQLTEALEIKADFAYTHRVLGMVYEQMNEDEKAEKIWKEGLHFNPNSSEILESMGAFYFKKQRFKEAKHYFEAAIKAQLDRYTSYFNLGQTLEEEKDFEAAIKAYEKALRFNPYYGPAHYRVGTLYAQKQDRRSLWHLKEAVKLMPSFGDAHNNLAVLYSSMEPQQLELARQHAKKALLLGYPVDEEFLKLINVSGEGGGSDKTGER